MGRVVERVGAVSLVVSAVYGRSLDEKLLSVHIEFLISYFHRWLVGKGSVRSVIVRDFVPLRIFVFIEWAALVAGRC